jgi:hypothetical protein
MISWSQSGLVAAGVTGRNSTLPKIPRGCQGVTSTNSRLDTRVGVVLFQLGGPDSLDAIEPFLYNLFCDPDIIDFPFARLAREPLARLISSRRSVPGAD